MKWMAGLILILLLALAPITAARADTCTAGDFASAVERSAGALREASRSFQPKLQDRMRRYQAAKGLSESDYEASALSAIEDKKIGDLDAKSSELLLKIDGLGRIPAGKEPVCAELTDIETLSKELLATVKAKSDYMLARLDEKIAEAAPKSKPAPSQGVAEAKPEAKPEPKPAAKTEPKAETKAEAKSEPKPAPPPDTWAADTRPDDAFVPIPDAGPGNGDGYTIEEVQEATRGFFGTISTSLASVIEHAFKTTGRPTAYVLGTEGGGAFLAGLRFGEGKLYMRHNTDVTKVWWHGPSIGGDVGATGARTMFLIYRLSDRAALFRSFTGIDGSAFFVGGVGMTVLKGGDVIMAPIRTGLGFRVGANIGYVRFTPEPTWNPF